MGGNPARDGTCAVPPLGYTTGPMYQSNHSGSEQYWFKSPYSKAS